MQAPGNNASQKENMQKGVLHKDTGLSPKNLSLLPDDCLSSRLELVGVSLLVRTLPNFAGNEAR